MTVYEWDFEKLLAAERKRTRENDEKAHPQSLSSTPATNEHNTNREDMFKFKTNLPNKAKNEAQNIHPFPGSILIDSLEKSGYFPETFVRFKSDENFASGCRTHPGQYLCGLLGPNPYLWVDYFIVIQKEAVYRQVRWKTVHPSEKQLLESREESEFLEEIEKRRKNDISDKVLSLVTNRFLKPLAKLHWKQWLLSSDIINAMLYVAYNRPVSYMPDEVTPTLNLIDKLETFMPYSTSFGACGIGYIVDSTTSPHTERYSITINTDKADGQGSHWVAFFLDTTSRYAAYFDPLGSEPLPDIMKTIVSLVDDAKKHHPSFVVDKDTPLIIERTSSALQSDAFNCGVWCNIFFENMYRGYTLADMVQGKAWPRKPYGTVLLPNEVTYKMRPHFFLSFDWGVEAY